ncbi:hypothetical protein HOI18_00280 [Candidatus Uhrbacteria bacterium]|jgi:hypothetical protein|nr:hypothetical protein [Candidatus Uhrbacteria bacterium]
MSKKHDKSEEDQSWFLAFEAWVFAFSAWEVLLSVIGLVICIALVAVFLR